MIEIREMTNRRAEKLEELTEVWEASARATHRFLTEEEIVRIRGYVPQAMAAVEHLVTAEEEGRAVGFFGTAGTRLGFVPYGRSKVDEEGGPYPILYLQLAGEGRPFSGEEG